MTTSRSGSQQGHILYSPSSSPSQSSNTCNGHILRHCSRWKSTCIPSRLSFHAVGSPADVPQSSSRFLMALYCAVHAQS